MKISAFRALVVLTSITFGPDIASAQTAETSFLLANLRSVGGPSNWVVVDLRANVVRDAAGAIESGSINWRLRYQVAGQFQVASLRIHGKSDSGAGVVVFRHDFSPPFQLQGAGATAHTLPLPITVRSGDLAALESFRRLLDNPSEHTVSLEVQGQPETAFSAPLWRRETAVLIGLLNPGTYPTAAVWAFAFVSRDAANRVVYGELLLGGSYRLPAQVTFMSLQIRDRQNGPALISVPLTTVVPAPSGSGDFPGSFARILPEDATAFRAFLELVESPDKFWMHLETGGPGQATLQGRVRKTDQMTFPLHFSSHNVVPMPTNWEERSVWTQIFHTVRNEDGTIAAAVWQYQSNLRFPEAAKLLGIHVHEGKAGVNGPIVYTISSFTPENSLLLPTGFGSALGIRTQSFMDGSLNEVINGLVSRPEDFYMDVHIEGLPDGSSRAQFGPAPGTPIVDSVVSANLDPASRMVAPGGLISIFGRNLAKVATNIDGWEGVVLPESMNGVVIGMGSLRPRPIVVSPTQIIAVLPLETPTETQELAVSVGGAVSQPVPLQVALVAPALFASPILKLSDLSAITVMNPVRAGDLILVYLTGLGQTTPALESGAMVDEMKSYTTVPVKVTVGGKDAQVLTSTARPGIPGLYQVVLRVPAGTRSGNVPLMLQAGSTGSNTVSIPVR